MGEGPPVADAHSPVDHIRDRESRGVGADPGENYLFHGSDARDGHGSFADTCWYADSYGTTGDCGESFEFAFDSVVSIVMIRRRDIVWTTTPR